MRFSVIRPSRTPKWWIICSRFSIPTAPFGIWRKSSFPSAFCSSVYAQWSVEIAWRAFVRTAFQRISWLLLRARRRGVHVVRGLEVLQPLEERRVDEEVLRARLAPDVPALLARDHDRLERLRARDVHDVERRAGDVRELDRAVRRLALDLRRARQRVVDRRRVAGRDRVGHQHLDRVAVLGVHHHAGAGPGGDLHHAEEVLVADAQRVVVGHEQLVRRDAVLLGQRRELLERAAVLAQVGDDDVEAVVDQRLALALRRARSRAPRRTSALAPGCRSRRASSSRRTPPRRDPW